MYAQVNFLSYQSHLTYFAYSIQLQNQWNEKRDSLNAESDRIANCTKEKRELLDKLTDQLHELRSHKEKLSQDKAMVRKNIEAMLKVNVRTEDSWSQAK